MEHESVGLSDEQLARIVAAYSAEPAEGEPPELGAVGGDPELTNLEGFSEADWSAITEFCGRVSDVVAAPEWRTASVFHRFLVARKGDADKAEAMYRAAMEWRREGRIDSLLWRYSEPAAMRQFFASGVIGADTAGFPVLIERTGAVDLAALGAAMGADAFLDWVAWYHERQERVMRVASAMASEVLGRPVLRHKMTVIVDLNGIGRGHLNSATLGVLQRRTGLEESNYPEVVRRVFIVRAPAIFSMTWTVVSTFVDPGTRAKMSLSSTGFLPAVRAVVPDRFIPAFLGGEYADASGEDCADTIGTGGTLPEAFRVGPDGEAEDATVPAGGAVRRVVRVPAGHSATLRWCCPSGDTFRVSSPSEGVDPAAADDTGRGPASLVPVAGAAFVTTSEAAPAAAAAASSSGTTASPAAALGLVTVSPSGSDREVEVVWTSTAWLSSQRLVFRAEVQPPAGAGATKAGP